MPSGKLTVMGLFVRHRFLTGVPFMMKIDVAPVLAMACEAAISIAFANSNCLKFFEQLDATNVVSLLSSSYDASIASAVNLLTLVGYNV